MEYLEGLAGCTGEAGLLAVVPESGLPSCSAVASQAPCAAAMVLLLLAAAAAFGCSDLGMAGGVLTVDVAFAAEPQNGTACTASAARGPYPGAEACPASSLPWDCELARAACTLA